MKIVWPSYMGIDERHLALEAIYLSRFAYYPESEVDEWRSTTAPLTVLEKPILLNGVFDAQAMVFQYESVMNKNLLAVGVSGSNSVKDYVCNLTIVPTGSDLFPENVRLHTGFLEQALALLPLLECVTARLESGEPVLFTGYSLGSSVAGILAALFAQRFPKQVFYIGFGNPCTGNDAFDQLLNNNTVLAINVQNCHDPICNIVLPPFVHCGTDVHIGESMRSYFPDALNGFDHLTVHYIANLKADCDELQTHPLDFVKSIFSNLLKFKNTYLSTWSWYTTILRLTLAQPVMAAGQAYAHFLQNLLQIHV